MPEASQVNVSESIRDFGMKHLYSKVDSNSSTLEFHRVRNPILR